MDALRLDARDPSGRLVGCTLGSDLATALASLKAEGISTAIVVGEADLAAILQTGDAIVDRGAKHQAKGLKEVLLGYHGIPVIRAQFRSPGRIAQGLRALLKGAGRAGDVNVYLIAVPDALFREAWKKSRPAEKAAEPPPSDLDGPPASFDDPAPQPPAATRSPQRCNLTHRLSATLPVPEIVRQTYAGASLDVQLVWQLIIHAARIQVPVMILGESGTGKELIAGLIHELSGQAGLFVPVNCNAIPRDLLQSELFGHARGAFTGAVSSKLGSWRLADQGTLLLDEVGDLAPCHQGMILRAIQDGAIKPVGADHTVRVRVRLVSATNRDLESMMANDTFRRDLFYRLGVFVIETPRLADHPEDLPVLANLFWRQILKRSDVELPSGTVAKLATYSWPGNCRELRSFLERLHALNDELLVPTPDLIRLPTDRPSGEEIGLERHALPATLQAHYTHCHRHLTSASEALRRCKVAVRRVVVNGLRDHHTVQTVRSELVQHLGSLEELCDHMPLFHTWPAFNLFRHVKGQLTTFVRHLDTDTDRAQTFWDGEVLHDHDRAARALFDATHRVEDAMRRLIRPRPRPGRHRRGSGGAPLTELTA